MTSIETKQEYINLDVEGVLIKVPSSILFRSKVIRTWYENTADRYIGRERVYYINSDTEDIYNLINYLYGNKYSSTSQLSELISELAIDETKNTEYDVVIDNVVVNNVVVDNIIKKVPIKKLPLCCIFNSR
jgi:hypothetical protein